MKIAVIGLGKLGSVMAAVLADKGYVVVGVDSTSTFVEAINEAKAPVEEPGLDDLIKKNRHRLSATADHEEAVAGAEVTFIVVPTPSDADGTFSLRYVLPATDAIGRVLRRKTDFHLAVLSSTVIPGSTGGSILPLLERVSGKKCGRDFGLCYSPEFIALGSVIRDMCNPDMALIGESDPRSGQMLADLYHRICENKPAVARMNFVNAELTKLSVNTFVTTKISYANMLTEICERLPGADVDVVTKALGLDTRIGSKYLKGALGYGGPCFPRDNIAFASFARRLGVEATLAEATDQANRRQVSRLGDLILAMLPEGGVAGILGLSYKPLTNVVEESQGLLVAQYLLDKGLRVVVYDPTAMDNARRYLSGKVIFASSIEQCVSQAQVLAITTPWEEFKSLRPEQLNRSMGRPTVVDCWRILPRERFEPVADYVTLGLWQGSGDTKEKASLQAATATSSQTGTTTT
jgi:UDPglucose 6-dehydrogenase